MSRLHLGLLPRIIIAIALGVGAGLVLPEWAMRIFATFNAVFSQFLTFLIPLIIVGFVAPSIAEIGRGAGKMLLFTAMLAYGATLFAGFLSYFAGTLFFPSLIGPAGYVHQAVEVTGPSPFFTIEIPPLCSVMTALILAFVLGLGASRLKGMTLREGLAEFRDIVQMCIAKVIIPLLPLYIFGIFMNMAAEGEVARVMGTFAKVVGVIFGLHVFLLILQYCVAAPFARRGHRNPLRLLWTMMPAYFTALGTQSSAATIPVTLKRSQMTGVSEDVAGFTIPLCATIHLSGSTLKIVACALALIISGGGHYDLPMFAGFIAMLGITMVAAPGVPGGAIMAALGLLSSMLGFTEADNALMIALYIAMDSFGTACNVTGDGAIAIIVDRFFGRKR